MIKREKVWKTRKILKLHLNFQKEKLLIKMNIRKSKLFKLQVQISQRGIRHQIQAQDIKEMRPTKNHTMDWMPMSHTRFISRIWLEEFHLKRQWNLRLKINLNPLVHLLERCKLCLIGIKDTKIWRLLNSRQLINQSNIIKFQNNCKLFPTKYTKDTLMHSIWNTKEA